MCLGALTINVSKTQLKLQDYGTSVQECEGLHCPRQHRMPKKLSAQLIIIA